MVTAPSAGLSPEARQAEWCMLSSTVPPVSGSALRSALLPSGSPQVRQVTGQRLVSHRDRVSLSSRSVTAGPKYSSYDSCDRSFLVSSSPYSACSAASAAVSVAGGSRRQWRQRPGSAGLVLRRRSG
jgi:hypothetical protein